MELNSSSCNSCKQCKFYVEHYIIMSTHLVAIGGHCINPALFTPKKKCTLHYNCNYWESNENLKLKRQKSINSVIEDIEKHLFEIKMILENDK